MLFMQLDAVSLYRSLRHSEKAPLEAYFNHLETIHN
jgi:hypothetical protein